ncbi:MAG: hypothetical protein ACOX4I_08275 [Anaerovoracaceae bacterium]|jgi:hypothetical protein
MSTMALTGLIILIVVVAVGITIKIYTRRQLRDMDGVSDTAIVHDGQNDRLVNK